MVTLWYMDGKRTSVYLTAADLEQLEALGSPSLAVLIRLGMDTMIRNNTQIAEIGPGKRRKAPKAGCDHPLARRDRKSGLCGACGTNVGPAKR